MCVFSNLATKLSVGNCDFSTAQFKLQRTVTRRFRCRSGRRPVSLHVTAAFSRPANSPTPVYTAMLLRRPMKLRRETRGYITTP